MISIQLHSMIVISPPGNHMQVGEGVWQQLYMYLWRHYMWSAVCK